ncbi:MoaD/ThiS family protein [Phenylobacterium soli]|uniref:Molybdopterin synthase sulfur carrier subunit n=1 Tax=Phenylobacterium soli TaxID=2170551 RepID=A0A328AL13_9CAUL|nr:MoaD/ThiS family protein [Phenylobacterium soli]RAK55161.1 molybdopterin synthase sulfur carrier subunit [Phenylobacterium soli]
MSGLLLQAPSADAPLIDEQVARVSVLFFGKVADVFGRAAEVEIPAAGCSVPALKVLLGELTEGGIEALCARGVRCAVDRDIVGDEAWIRPGQEVAFFSMFSGG